MARRDEFEQAVEKAARERGTTTREGLVLNEKTGELSDAMQFELDAEDD